jgi:hypothetical protein
MLEVVYLHEPAGAPMGERLLDGLRVVCRPTVENEFRTLQEDTGVLRLIVATPQQAWELRDVFAVDVESSKNVEFGLLLVESGDDEVTVRFRKRIEAAALYRAVHGDVRFPSSLQNFLTALNSASSHLFLQARSL